MSMRHGLTLARLVKVIFSAVKAQQSTIAVQHQ